MRDAAMPFRLQLAIQGGAGIRHQEIEGGKGEPAG
jgi:hypothetical protein